VHEKSLLVSSLQHLYYHNYYFFFLTKMSAFELNEVQIYIAVCFDYTSVYFVNVSVVNEWKQMLENQRLAHLFQHCWHLLNWIIC